MGPWGPRPFVAHWPIGPWGLIDPCGPGRMGPADRTVLNGLDYGHVYVCQKFCNLVIDGALTGTNRSNTALKNMPGHTAFDPADIIYFGQT